MTSHPSHSPVSALRERMIEDMIVRGFNAKTRNDYIRNVPKFSAFIGRSPDTATAEEVRRFQLHQAKTGVSASSINSAVSALRFLFHGDARPAGSTDDELEHEIVSSRAAIHEATGIWPELFAYPYGLWDQRVREHVRAAGYRAALTLDAGLNRTRSDPWSLRRVNVPARISDAAFEAWTAGLGPARGA